jgi:membrane protein implicated in regulation of membrane protease activity
MLLDSYGVKILSLLAMVFLPISTIATVFGTEFFTSGSLDSSITTGTNDTLVVSNKFWLLWVISLPITMTLVGGWWVWMRRTRRVPKRKTDAEA